MCMFLKIHKTNNDKTEKICKFTIIIENFSTLLSNRISTQINSKGNEETDINQWIQLTFIEHSIPQQRNTYFLKCTWKIHQDRPYPE